MGFDGLVELASPLPPMPDIASNLNTAPREAPVAPTSVVHRANEAKKSSIIRKCVAPIIVMLALSGIRSLLSTDYVSAPRLVASYSPSYQERTLPPVLQGKLDDVVGPESVPPATAGQLLSREQIRYCLAEKVRLSAIRDKVDGNIPVVRRMFDVKVANYNSRCASYRYSQADMVAASRVVTDETFELQRDADIWR